MDMKINYFGYHQVRKVTTFYEGNDTIDLGDVALKPSEELMREVEVKGRMRRFTMSGDTVVFHHKIGKQRAKQFVTRVALAGRYEVFELAEEKFTIQTSAYGGAARIGLEEFLDGRVQWSDYLEIVNEGMSEAVYKEIAKALIAAIEKFPATNKVASAGFNEAQFDRLIQTVPIYGSPVIYCTLEGAMTLLPNNNWISESMKDEHWQNGYFTKYKGTPVVVLPQSFEDETNKMKVIDPARWTLINYFGAYDFEYVTPRGVTKTSIGAFSGLFANEKSLAGIKTSALLSVCAAALACIIVVVACSYIMKHKKSGKIVEYALLFPWLLPTILICYSYRIFFNSEAAAPSLPSRSTYSFLPCCFSKYLRHHWRYM